MPEICDGSVQNNVLVVTVLLDQLREAQAAYALRDRIIALINESQPTSVVLDLAKVNFVGSVGFLAFLGVRRQLNGGRIILSNLSNPIRDMFSVCRLIATDTNTAAPFETASTTQEALARLAA